MWNKKIQNRSLLLTLKAIFNITKKDIRQKTTILKLKKLKLIN